MAYKKSKVLPIDSNDEELPIFEKCPREEEDSNHEEEGPSEPMQQVIILENRKRPNWLKSTLQDAEGHAVATCTFKESKKPKRYSGYASYMTKLIEAEPSTLEEVSNH